MRTGMLEARFKTVRSANLRKRRGTVFVCERLVSRVCVSPATALRGRAGQKINLKNFLFLRV